MYLLDEHKRNFIRWSSKYVDRHLEDPSYIGFHIRFNFNEISENDFIDLVPGGLLYIDTSVGIDDWVAKGELDENGNTTSILQSSSKYSALNYLDRLEKNNFFPKGSKTELLRGLISELIYIQNKTPWFFQSLSGLDSAFKIAHDGYRLGDGGSITINTLESIDRRISFLIDAYRKVAWDMNSMSWILPENLRKFGMEIIVCEFNTIHTKDRLFELSQESFTNELKFLENNFPGAYNILRKSEARVQQFKDVFDALGAESPSIREIVSSFLVLDHFTDVTVHIYQLQECEFDVLGDYVHPYLNDISMEDAGEQLTNEIPIKFKRSNIISSYSLLDYIMSDKKDLIPTGQNDSRFQKYYEYYYKNRDLLADEYVQKRAKDIAKAILLGNYNPIATARNVVTGTARNISALPNNLII